MTKDDMILDWETLKKETPDKAELFNMLEEEAMSELVTGRDSIPNMLVIESGLIGVDCADDLRNDHEKFMSLIHYFAEKSVYAINTSIANGELCFDVSLDNVGLLLGVSLIYVDAVLWHVTGSFPIKLRIHFRNDAARDYTDKMIRDCVLPLFSDIKSYEAIVDEDEEEEEPLVQRAIEFATVAHTGAVRKGTDIPYIVHPMDVMKIVSGITDDEEVRAAAVLHDTVEDTVVTREDIEETFGERVAELVASESENKREDEPEEKTWRVRKQETLDRVAIADTDTRIICLGDKLANMRDIARDYESIGDVLWERFNAPDDDNGIAGKKANIGWYYRGIADRLRGELGYTDAWHELDSLIVKVFDLEGRRPRSEAAELIGYNRQLEDAIVAFHESDDDDGELSGDVFYKTVLGVAAHDKWYVPVIPCEKTDEDMIQPEKFCESMLVRMSENQLAMVNLNEVDGASEMLVYTSLEKIPKESYFVGLSSRRVLECFGTAHEVERLWLNPDKEGESYWFSKEEAKKLLEAAEACDISDVTDEMYYALDPLAVIDTDKIIEDWKSGWSESFETEAWKLEAYPVMPDGTVLLLFCMEDVICEGKIDDLKKVHVSSYYRVLQYKLGSNGPEIINKFRFSIQDCKVGTVFVRDDKLYATVATRYSNSYTVLQMFPNDDDAQFPIGTYIKDVVPKMDGNTFVSYYDNQNDKHKAPVAVFNADGEVAGRYIEKLAITCKAMTLDADENIWYHCYPSGEITEIGTDNEFGERHCVELQGFNVFAFSDDKSVLVAEFSEYNDESIIFVMHRDGDGDYGTPIRFAFEPKDNDDAVINSEDCDYFGCPSVCKSTMLLRANGYLYWYNVNAFA